MRTPKVSLAVLLAMGLRAQGDPAAALAALEAELPRLRAEVRHEAATSRYEALLPLLAEAAAQGLCARRAAELRLERDLLGRLGTEEAVRALDVRVRVARLCALERSPRDDLVLARLAFFAGEAGAGEEALGQARDADPALRGESDALLAEARGEPVPPGGYHRYRGAWLALAARDRAAALDAALEALAGLGMPSASPPFALGAAGSHAPSFDAGLGVKGPAWLRAAAEQVRAALRKDEQEARALLPSYAGQPGLRKALLEQRAALAEPRGQALELIRRYDKPQQPDVDALRARVERLYADYVELRRRDVDPARLPPARAFELLQRIRSRGAALAAVDAFLTAHAPPGLPQIVLEPATGAATSSRRWLPGRSWSALEDVPWLWLHARAGQWNDVQDRAAELGRWRAELSPWEAMVVEEALADAIEAIDERLATGLDAEERRFVRRVNAYRRALGLAPFEVEERLNASARKHSQEMVELRYFGHVSPVERHRGPSDRSRLEGYAGGVGENCLAGSAGGEGAFEAWYHSPGHHRNLISGGPHLGVGAWGDHGMWTMVCGGTDRTWRGLHGDQPPGRAAELDAAAEALARAWLLDPKDKRTAARLAQARARVSALLPDVLPSVARIGLAAANDPGHGLTAAWPSLLALVAEAEVAVAWRPLQVAAVAAAIDGLARPAPLAVREQALARVQTWAGDTCGYDARAPRYDAIAALRVRWQDTAQWTFRAPAGSAAPPRPRALPGRGDGPSLAAPRQALTRAERLRLASLHGGGPRSEQAVELGLRFLARAQDEDGAWRARAFALRTGGSRPEAAGIGNAEWELAMTGLALLAFTATGSTHRQGDYQDTVQRGMEWLLRAVVDYGRFETAASHYMYGHAMATQALCELYALTADPRLWPGAQLAVDYLAYAQHRPSGGWRYEPNEEADTSVTGWVILALNAAYKGELDVAGFRGAQRFLESVTSSGYYQTGYMRAGDQPPRGSRLDAVGLASRLFLGQPRGESRIVLPAWRLRSQPPDPDDPDFYRWYYGTLALFQVGGDFWKEWNAALLPALLGAQETRADSPLAGSWPPDRHYGSTGGRVYQTALGVLMLSTYYRYDRALSPRVHPFTGDLRKELAPYLEALDHADAQRRAVVIVKLVDHFGGEAARVLLDELRAGKRPLVQRIELAEALVTIAEPRHEALVLELLADAEAAIANAAARAAARIVTTRSLPALQGALAHGNHVVRAFAARALGRLGEPAASAALGERLAAEGDGWVRAEIQGALARIAHRGALHAVVVRALPADATGRVAALEALDLLEQRGLGAKVEACAAREPALWARCAQAIAAHGAACPVPVLLVLLESDDEPTREGAAAMLVALTGADPGFEAKGDERARRAGVARWQAWWKEHAAEMGGR